MASRFTPDADDEEGGEAEKEPGMDLSIPMTIAELIAIRGEIIQSWTNANAAIRAVDSAFHRIHDKDFVYFLESGGRRSEYGTRYAIKEMTEALDYSLFVFALGKLNITNAMTENAKDKFLAEIKAKKTVFDETQLTGLAQNAHKLFRDSSLNTVRDVWRQLIGASYRADAGSRLEKKKDNLQKVEKVFRVGWSDVKLSSGWNGRSLETSGWRYGSASNCFHFNDLLTACRLIEGEGVPDYSNNLESMIRALPRGTSQMNTGYFQIQAYLNGNVKVKWNEDKIHILEKLNAIGSGRENAMPDSLRKRYKASHFHNGGAPDPFTFFAPDPKMVPNDEKDFAFFWTQEEAAARVAVLAEYDRPGLETLEPSAGDGKLMRVVAWAPGSVAIEFNHHRAEKILDAFPKWDVQEADFLKWQTDRQFDRVVMNPPFHNRIEAVHVVKAFTHLRPGGILVAIIPGGWFTRNDQKATVFRTFLQAYEHKPSELLPAGSFKRTRVETRIIILKKPIETPKSEG